MLRRKLHFVRLDGEICDSSLHRCAKNVFIGYCPEMDQVGYFYDYKVSDFVEPSYLMDEHPFKDISLNLDRVHWVEIKHEVTQ